MSDHSKKGARAPARRFLRLVAMIAGASSLGAATAEAQSFDELAALLADHPSVTALLSESAAREELAIAAGGLPDPAISIGVNNVPLSDPAFDRVMMTNKSIGVRQEIPSWGVRRARADKERGEALANELAAEYRLSLLRAELIAALADKERIHAQTGYAEAKLRLYRELDGILKGELEAGRSIYYRLSQVDVERADVERALAGLGAELAGIDASLVDLIGDAPDIPPPPIELASWDGDGLSLHAARIADAGVDAAKAGVAEGKAAFGPNFGVQLTYHQREASDPSLAASFSGDDWFSAGVTFSAPLWAPRNQAPKLRAAKAREARARASYQSNYRDARELLTTLTASYVASRRNIEILQTKAAALDQVIAAARRNYEAGRGDYLPVIDSEIGRLTLLSELAAERARVTSLAAQANSQLVVQ